MVYIMNYRTAYRLSICLWIAGGPLFVLGMLFPFFPKFQWLLRLGLILLIAGIAIDLLFYRCPHCGKSLCGVRGALPSFCPFCGRPLS